MSQAAERRGGVPGPTERTNADEALHGSEERFRLLVGTVRDYAIFMLDPTGHVVTWNEGAQRINGYSESEIIGRHFSIFYPPEAVASEFPEYELKMAAEAGRYEDEDWRIRKDGSRFWSNVVITALREEDGELVGFAKVTRDLTERREAQERAIAGARRLAEMEADNRSKLEFLSAVSHELRTPLNAIGGYGELLDLEVPGQLNEAQKQFIGRIRQAQQHLLTLVSDLLNYARIGAGRLEYDLTPVTLPPLVRELSGLVQPQAMEKNLTFEMGGCPSDAIAWADAARVRQILLNLFSNAMKFTPAGGRICTACSTTDSGVRATVSDTGPGIPDDKREAVFEPFMQLGRTGSQEGVGLGLSISRELARGMGGDLTANNHDGHGAVFTLVLPRSQKESSGGRTLQDLLP